MVSRDPVEEDSSAVVSQCSTGKRSKPPLPRSAKRQAVVTVEKNSKFAFYYCEKCTSNQES